MRLSRRVMTRRLRMMMRHRHKNTYQQIYNLIMRRQLPQTTTTVILVKEYIMPTPSKTIGLKSLQIL